ncbi:hydroxypyruvate isomerase family protein [Minwuia thermotolerans]|uniref:Hydroxypyruvate isomerase n=1 Tax=Minwuia thermotolerans TaxID=2056226 RepID=A0A2M9G7F9_9PROT|nr:TIM barrel protein [Minwuia thermotolerans]PJK31633.1 hydroxypyruvate isomerase [Minwuia thermotolerans]
MPRFSANIDMLFTELPFLERFEAAAAHGFTEVEILNPHIHDREAMRAERDRHGLGITLINMPIPRMADGDRGAAVDPAATERFLEEAERTLDLARFLEAPRVHVLAGRAEPGDAAAEAAFVEHVQRAAAMAADAGVRLMLEPINTRDIPGYFLRTVDQALRILDRVGRDNVFLQFDAYHVQVMSGDIVHRFRAAFDRIGHVQIANPPDRHEPGRGEIDFAFFFEQVDALGYDGRVSLEYRPATTTSESLAWGAPWGLGAGAG